MAAKGPTVEKRHLEAARTVLKQQFGNWTEDIPLVAQALANAEAAAAAKAVEPWHLLAKYASETTCSLEPSWHGESGGWTIDAVNGIEHLEMGAFDHDLQTCAVNLCIKLGLLPSEPRAAP